MILYLLIVHPLLPEQNVYSLVQRQSLSYCVLYLEQGLEYSRELIHFFYELKLTAAELAAIGQNIHERRNQLGHVTYMYSIIHINCSIHLEINITMLI